jgi:hypothetical protein
MATTEIFENMHCLYTSRILDVLPENMGPRIISRYPDMMGWLFIYIIYILLFKSIIFKNQHLNKIYKVTL